MLVRRAGPLERAVARVCREAGAGSDERCPRRLEVVANGLPGFGGVQVAVDATLVSPVRRPTDFAPRLPGVPGRGAVPPRCRCPRGWGALGDETEAFLHRLARGKALDQRGKVAAAYARRWGQLPAVAAQGALAASLSSLPPDAGDAAAGAPPQGDDICDARWAPDS